MNADGEKLDCVRIANDGLGLLEQVSRAGSDCEVVIEATYGWYWAVDLLRDAGFSVHLSHPSGNDWGNRRVKNDERDARDLADLLRLGRLAEAWIFRDRPELVRNATADAFPTSFDVLLAPQADWIAIKNQFERLAGVDQVIFTA